MAERSSGNRADHAASDRDVVITREFDAPRRLVWQA